MDRLRISSKTWVLVCDGSKALLFQNMGDAQALNLKALEVFVEPHPPTRDLGTDRPGRTYDSMGGSRSSVQDPDRHQQAEDRFLRETSNKIDELVRSATIKALVIAAPPKALGILRTCMTPATRAVVSAEIAKDLVKLPTKEIEQHLATMGELS